MRLIPSFVTLSPLLVLLASCVGPGQQQRPPVGPAVARPGAADPAPVAPATPGPVATEWLYRPATPGTWSYRTDAGGSVAQFGASAADPVFSLHCDRAARRISLARAGAGQGVMLLRTSYGAVSWPATVTTAPAQVVATRAASDTVLDQLAYSRGRFAVEVQGLTPLIVPAWAEVGRVIEDCRG